MSTTTETDITNCVWELLPDEWRIFDASIEDGGAMLDSARDFREAINAITLDDNCITLYANPAFYSWCPVPGKLGNASWKMYGGQGVWCPMDVINYVRSYEGYPDFRYPFMLGASVGQDLEHELTENQPGATCAWRYAALEIAACIWMHAQGVVCAQQEQITDHVPRAPTKPLCWRCTMATMDLEYLLADYTFSECASPICPGCPLCLINGLPTCCREI